MSIIRNAHAATTVLAHAERCDLPLPSTVTFFDFDSISFTVRTLDDLTQWAAYLEATIGNPGVTSQSLVYKVDGMILEQQVSVAAVVPNMVTA